MYAHLAEEFATELINVRSDTELDGALKLVSRRLGFDHFALSLEDRRRTTHQDCYCTTIPTNGRKSISPSTSPVRIREMKSLRPSLVLLGTG